MMTKKSTGIRNRTLALTAKTIPYVKELRPHTDSVTAAILMQQLEYRFHQYPDGFYKFTSACEHPDYREGDSWTEELGFSQAEFVGAFDKIGVRYSSKTAFNACPEAERFFTKGDNPRVKFYASYHDRAQNTTWYFRNHDAVDCLLNGLFGTPSVNQQSPFTVNEESAFTVNEESRSLEINNVDLRKSRELNYVNPDSSSTLIRSRENTEKTQRESGKEVAHADSLAPQLTELGSALCRICKIDPDLMSPTLWQQLQLTETALAAAGKTPDDVARFGRIWWTADFRGQQNSAPRLNQVRDEWQRVMALEEPFNGSTVSRRPLAPGICLECNGSGEVPKVVNDVLVGVKPCGYCLGGAM